MVGHESSRILDISGELICRGQQIALSVLPYLGSARVPRTRGDSFASRNVSTDCGNPASAGGLYRASQALGCRGSQSRHAALVN